MTNLDITHSPEIAKIAGALSKAQGAVKAAAKDATNPGFRTTYADLNSVWEACRGALSANELAVIQVPFNSPDGSVGISTMLAHSSGEWFRGSIAVKPMKFDAQGVGSVITYLRRYSLAAMVGVAPGDDDDGEGAAGRGKAQGGDIKGPPTPRQEPARPAARPAASIVVPPGSLPIHNADGIVISAHPTSQTWMVAAHKLIAEAGGPDAMSAAWAKNITVFEVMRNQIPTIALKTDRDKAETFLSRFEAMLSTNHLDFPPLADSTVLAAG